MWNIIARIFRIWTQRDGAWHRAENPTQMRRYTSNGWEYRRATPEEESARAEEDAW
jgi:hypothetical protein